MKLPAFGTVLPFYLIKFSSALIMNRAEVDSLEPLLGVPPQVRQGDLAVWVMRYPPQTISKISLKLQSPDGTVSTPISSSLFTNGTGTLFDPTTRFCVPRGAFTSPHGGSHSQQVEQSGNWSVSLEVTYYFGSNGYEYDFDDNVCISPPFSSEVAETESITMVVLPSSTGSSTPVVTPTPTPVDLQGTVTGSTFLLTGGTNAPPSNTSTIGTATGISTNAALLAKGWKRGTEVLSVGIAFSLVML